MEYINILPQIMYNDGTLNRGKLMEFVTAETKKVKRMLIPVTTTMKNNNGKITNNVSGEVMDKWRAF